MSQVASEAMIDTLKKNPNANICVASGDSPQLTYQLFVEKVLDQHLDVSNLMITKLDEWCNVNSDSPLSCELYIHEMLIQPLHMKQENFISFHPDVLDFEEEVKHVHQQLMQHPIDLCILGLGKNGHLGLNEPSTFNYMNSHVEKINEITKNHPMIKGSHVEYGMSIGMKDIMDSKKVILLMCGEGKQKIVDQFMEQKITNLLPATFLWLHNHCDVIVQSDLYKINN